MVPLTGQNTINDMVDRINEVSQEIENVSAANAGAVVGPASSSADQIMAFSDTTGKNAKAANISSFVYSILDDDDDAAVRETLGLKSAAVLDAATAATVNTVVQRDASGNITGVGITATSGFVGNGSQITSLNMGNAASGTLPVAYGGTGTTVASGTGAMVKNTSPTLAGTPLSTTALADTNTTQIATTAFVIGQASSASPVMDGTATVGTSLRYARADHVHPSDTSKVNTSLLGVANGVATLDSGGKVPTSQLPAYVDDVLEYANLASFPATGETGKIYVAIDTNKTYRWSGSTYIYITSGAVDSVAGKTGVVSLVKGDVGLGNVDNTSDANKPVSTAQQSALNLKANIASPELTGTPTAPTATVGTNTTQLATTAYTVAEIDNRAPTKTGVGASGSWGISVTGNAATATKLATARTINGVAFDGSANITVADSTKQPLNTTLTALGNLTTDSNKLPYFAGVSVATTTDITSFGRSLIDDEDASTARTTLGLGTSAVENATITAIANTVVKRGSDGKIEAARLTIGDATDSSSKGINYSGTSSANQSSYGVFSEAYTTDATLTADRVLAGSQFVAEQNVNSAEAFSVTSYGLNAVSRSGTAAGGWSVTGEGNYYGVNTSASYLSTDATYKYVQSLIGVRSQAIVSTDAAAVAASAFAFHGSVQNLKAGATITTAYGLYLTYTSTGTITNKWSIYSTSNAWVGYHAGKMRFGGSATQSPRGVVDVVGDLYFDSIALGPDAVNIDTITANGHITNVTTNTTGTFQVFQPKDGVILTYSDGTDRTQLHYASNGIWFRHKDGAATYGTWVPIVNNDSTGLSVGSCSFNGTAGISILRNTASLTISRTGVGTYQINTLFGMPDHLPVVAMTSGARAILNTRAGSSGLVLATYGYNNTTLSDSGYICVILGN